MGYLERGEYRTSLNLALRLARVLGASAEDLFSLEPFSQEVVP